MYNVMFAVTFDFERARLAHELDPCLFGNVVLAQLLILIQPCLPCSK